MYWFFISYRRGDYQLAAKKLAEALADRFGEDAIYFDRTDPKLGEDYESHIFQVIPKCNALLAVIGPDWLNDENRGRLQDPKDLVRREIEAAGPGKVILVLIGRAKQPLPESLPDTLTFVSDPARNYEQLDDGPHFDDDVRDFGERLERQFGNPRPFDGSAWVADLPKRRDRYGEAAVLRALLADESIPAVDARNAINIEREYLAWLANDVQRIGQLWHESPIVETPAHLPPPKNKQRLTGWRSVLFRHVISDYELNPALSDLELSARAGFGKRKKIKDLAKELHKFNKIIVLGDPGSGKSVCLRQLAFDLAQRELGRNSRPRTIPVFVDMGTYDGWHDESAREPMKVLNFLRLALISHEQVQERPRTHPLIYIAKNLETLLTQGRVTCIFDALDEMPQDSYQDRYQELKKFIACWEIKPNRFVCSCRTLDYDPAFEVDEVIIDPFNRVRIEQFLHGHLPSEVALELLQRIDEDELLAEMVSNPFFLQALAYINQEPSERPKPNVPTTRGALIRAFVEASIEREAVLKQPGELNAGGGRDQLMRFLADLAFTIQKGETGGTAAQLESLQEVLNRYPNWLDLFWIARRARILGKRGENPDLLAQAAPDRKPPSRVEFVHHRLQEYFAASELAHRLQADEPLEEYLDDIWWHETVILATGIVKDPKMILQKMLAPRRETAEWLQSVDDAAQRLTSSY